MSLLLPSELPFGRLEVDETWLEFDGPRLFIARNRTGQAFLFNAIDEDESSIVYLAVPVSDQRRTMLRSGGVGLRAAFLRPEEGLVFRVECDYVEDVVRVSAVTPEALDEADLPMPDAVISIATDTLRPFTPSRLGDRAAAEGRTLIALRLNPPTATGTNSIPMINAAAATRGFPLPVILKVSHTTPGGAPWLDRTTAPPHTSGQRNAW